MYLKSFKKLIVWQKSIELVEEIYILTKDFPKEETYGLSSQMRRASVSIPSNIAEGQRRKDVPESLQFLRIADASSAELETQLIIAKKLYPNFNYSRAENLLDEIQKMLYKMKENLELKAKSSKLTANSGFTVIELIVSMSLFVIISGIVVGSFITATRTQREIISLIEARDNMSIAMEQMAREVRLGTNFSVSPTGDGIIFNNLNGDEISYVFDNDLSTINRCKNLVCFPIIAKSLNIRNFKTIYINYFGVPRISVSFSVIPKEKSLKENFSFNIQTTISGRQF